MPPNQTVGLGWSACQVRQRTDYSRDDGGCKRRGGETSTRRSDCHGDEIRPWHSAGVNQLVED